MLGRRTFIAGSLGVALLEIAFLTGRATAQQPVPTEHRAAYSFPISWGELVDTVPGQTGLTFVFERKNGLTDSFIRLVHTGPGDVIGAIEVIPRR